MRKVPLTGIIRIKSPCYMEKKIYFDSNNNRDQHFIESFYLIVAVKIKLLTIKLLAVFKFTANNLIFYFNVFLYPKGD